MTAVLDKSLVTHCAPTLASLKTGSLFTVLHLPEESLCQQIDHWNFRLKGKGVYLTVLRRGRNGTLLYVFRPQRLTADLARPGVAAFLRRYGYCDLTAQGAVERLRQRLGEGEEFPHEIGLFLGYPLEDVEGFMENRGKNCKCTGCWKVYGDEQAARLQFSRYEKCRTVYLRLFHAGRSVEELTVAV